MPEDVKPALNNITKYSIYEAKEISVSLLRGKGKLTDL